MIIVTLACSDLDSIHSMFSSGKHRNTFMCCNVGHIGLRDQRYLKHQGRQEKQLKTQAAGGCRPVGEVPQQIIYRHNDRYPRRQTRCGLSKFELPRQ